MTGFTSRLLGTALLVFSVAVGFADDSRGLTLLDDGDRELMSVAFSPSGELLAVSSADHSIKLWDLKSRQKFKTLDGKTGLASCLSFGSDDRSLGSGSRDGTIAIWNIATGQVVKKATFPGATWHSLRPLANGKWLAAGSDDKSVRLWSSDDKDQTKEFIGHEFAVGDVAFSPDGKNLVSGDFRGHLRIWNVAGSVKAASPNGVAGSICDLAVGPSFGFLAIGDSTSALRICTLPDFRSSELRSYGDEVETVDHLAISPDGKYLAAGIRDAGEIEFWDIMTKKNIATLPARFLNAVAFSPNGKLFASVDSEGVKLWDVQSVIDND